MGYPINLLRPEDLRDNPLSSVRAVSAANEGGPSRFSNVATWGTAPILVKASAGRLYAMHWVRVAAGTTYFIQYHDKATVPVNGDTPIWVRRAPASTEGTHLFDPFGLYFANVIYIALSTTVATLTLSPTDELNSAGWYK